MISRKIRNAVLVSAFLLCAASAHAVRDQVNWPEFLARQDMIWERMPQDYFEGPFVGNGLLGAILFKDDQEPNTLRLEVGRTDVYDHRTKGAHPIGRLPIGQLLLTPVGEIQDVHLRVDLWNAEIRGEIKTAAGTLEIRCFVPSGESLIVLKLKSTGRESEAKCVFRPEQGNHPRPTVAPNRDKNVVYTPNPSFVVEKLSGIDVLDTYRHDLVLSMLLRHALTGSPAARTVLAFTLDRRRYLGEDVEALTRSWRGPSRAEIRRAAVQALVEALS